MKVGILRDGMTGTRMIGNCGDLTSLWCDLYTSGLVFVGHSFEAGLWWSTYDEAAWTKDV